MNVHSVKPAPFLFFHFPHFPRLDGDLDQTDSLLADWLDPNHLIASVTIIRPSVLLANNSEQDGIDPPYPITAFNACSQGHPAEAISMGCCAGNLFRRLFLRCFCSFQPCPQRPRLDPAKSKRDHVVNKHTEVRCILFVFQCIGDRSIEL